MHSLFKHSKMFFLKMVRQLKLLVKIFSVFHGIKVFLYIIWQKMLRETFSSLIFNRLFFVNIKIVVFFKILWILIISSFLLPIINKLYIFFLFLISRHGFLPMNDYHLVIIILIHWYLHKQIVVSGVLVGENVFLFHYFIVVMIFNLLKRKTGFIPL